MPRPTRRPLCCAVAVSVLTLFLPASASAQSVSGTIFGTVIDQTDQVLPGATVLLVNEQTGVSRSQSTNEVGRFVLSSVQPAIYTIRIEMAGFRPFERKNVVLPANEQLSIGTVRLALGGLTETVTTVAQGSFVQTTSSERSALITSTQLEMVAVRGRDIVSLLKVLPGVSYQSESESPGAGFGTSTPNIAGNRNTWNTLTVDGLVGNDLGSPQVFSSSINFDAIAEVKVQLNNYQAEHGRNGGALVNIVTKSGTRDFRGSAYAYRRHEQFNANDFFNKANGLPKPLYRYTTLGATLGGPALLPGARTRDKLFFFYSFENWASINPRGLQRVTVPSELERAGDFSQSLDQNGRLIEIRDPLTGLPFLGNRIPASRINPNGQAILSVFPRANALDRSATLGNYNYLFQESLDVPKRQHVGRVDYRPTAKDSLYGRLSTWYADNKGFSVPAGSSAWGLIPQHYTFTDDSLQLSYTRIVSSALVNELSVGWRHSEEAGPPLSQDGLDRVTRRRIGFTLGQFNPQLNPLDVIPRASFGGIPNPANITYDGRFPLTGADTLYTVNNVLTFVRGAHTYKAGLYAEHARNEEGRTATFAGDFNFGRDANNPLDTGHPHANALLGVFRSYTESTSRPGGDGTATLAEWFAQDTWRPTRKLTLDYGARFARYTQYYQRGGAAAAFALERFDRGKAPRLYTPARVDGQIVARDPQTGAVVPAALIGAIVPGSGDPANGMVVGTDPTYPRGFRTQPPVLLEPRVGFAYDFAGDGRTALRGSFGIFHQTRASGNFNWTASRNPPLQFNPVIFNGTMDALLSSTGVLFPSSVQGFEKDTGTPTLYSYTVGIQRDIGWGTVVDVAYVGSKGRQLSQQRNINRVPYGARFLPENADPARPGRPLSDNFFRPIPGYTDITFRENSGISNYDGLQVQATRRFTHGLQFGVAYTWSTAHDYGSSDTSDLPLYQDVRAWTYGLADYDQTHVAVFNYTWDLPKASRVRNAGLVRALLDDWQLSGITAFASGVPRDVGLTTTDAFDFTGGGDGTRVVVTGDPTLPGDQRGLDGWFNTAVFARPARGQIGNGQRDLIRLPGVSNWDITLFKRIPLAGEQHYLQLRLEIYNVFNTTQFNDVDRTARFDPAGNQVNARFGRVISARAPRVMQGSIRFIF